MAICPIVLLALTAHPQAPMKRPDPTPTVVQGVVKSVAKSIIAVAYPGGFPRGRQVDISTATYETAAGKVVPPFSVQVGDRLLIVVDPKAPTTYRPKPGPSGVMPMYIRLLPLKALVVERLQGTGPINLPGSDKG